MKDTSHIKKIFLTLALLSVIVIVAYGVLFWVIKSKNENISQLETEASVQGNRSERLQVVERTLQETKKERNKLNSYFIQPGQEGVVQFIETVEGLAENAGVSLKKTVETVPYSGEEINNNKDSYEMVVLNLTVEGSWQNTFSFLQKVEHLPYKVILPEVTMNVDISEDSSKNSDTQGVQNGNWTGTIMLKALKLK